VAFVLGAWQAVEALRLQRKVEARSLHLGAFVTIVVAMVGLELYGIGGALIGLVAVVLLAATLDEVFGHGPRSSSPSVTSET
jgi:predicted PurR-regulated permease PerM